MTETTVALDQQTTSAGINDLKARAISDYSFIPAAYRNIARNYATPLLIGPPLCDELIALVQHMYTEIEAVLAQHVTSPLGISACVIAQKEHLPVNTVVDVLDHLIAEKGILLQNAPNYILNAINTWRRYIRESPASGTKL